MHAHQQHGHTTRTQRTASRNWKWTSIEAPVRPLACRKRTSVSPSLDLQLHWTEGPKVFSLVMLFKSKEELVIRACCGKTHRHTTIKKHENLITRSAMQAQWCARENHDGSHSSAGFVTVLLSGDASSRFSLCYHTRNLFNTVLVFSVGFSIVLALVIMFDTCPRPCTDCSRQFTCDLGCVFGDFCCYWEIASDEISMVPFRR